MQDFDISDVRDEDRVEITDLDPQNDGSSTSSYLVLLRLVRKIPLFVNTRARSTTLALLACVIILLFLVQPGLPDISRQTSSTSALATSYAVHVQSPHTIIDAPSAHNVTWIRISNGNVIVIQASTETSVWHYCRVQHSFTLPKNTHPIVVICT
jgi:hypothetical protein